jgi:hypothetical protein
MLFVLVVAIFRSKKMEASKAKRSEEPTLAAQQFEELFIILVFKFHCLSFALRFKPGGTAAAPGRKPFSASSSSAGFNKKPKFDSQASKTGGPARPQKSDGFHQKQPSSGDQPELGQKRKFGILINLFD